MKADGIKELVWEEIGRDLVKDGGVETCLCWGADFFSYLKRNLRPPFKIKLARSGSPPPGRSGTNDLIIGWEVLQGEESSATLELIYQILKEGGEARLFGFYRHPVADDILLWERKCRQRGEGKSMALPLPGAVSLAQITSWVGATPFEHYIIRKKGIYYQALLIKEGKG